MVCLTVFLMGVWTLLNLLAALELIFWCVERKPWGTKYPIPSSPLCWSTDQVKLQPFHMFLVQFLWFLALFPTSYSSRLLKLKREKSPFQEENELYLHNISTWENCRVLPYLDSFTGLILVATPMSIRELREEYSFWVSRGYGTWCASVNWKMMNITWCISLNIEIIALFSLCVSGISFSCRSSKMFYRAACLAQSTLQHSWEHT